MDITELLAFAVKNKASDLHLSAGLPPMIRVHGDVRRINLPPMEHEDVHAMVYDIMSDAQRKTYEENLECDFSFARAEPRPVPRQRVRAAARRRGGVPDDPVEGAHAGGAATPKVFADMTNRPRGLILVTGPTGSGKSTTLAAMVDHVNANMYGHILTIEDPIEFMHESKKCLINQRELGPHTLSFPNALRSALREDPDYILVGEMRDLETIRLALTAAETGHLVFATLHTSSAAKTIDRIIDVFPAAEKEMVRAMLSESLVSVISQTLLKTKDGQGRVAAHEIMIGTPAIRNLIREGKVAQMYSAIQTGQNVGMQTLDQYLIEMVRRNMVNVAEARKRAVNKDLFPERCDRVGAARSAAPTGDTRWNANAPPDSSTSCSSCWSSRRARTSSSPPASRRRSRSTAGSRRFRRPRSSPQHTIELVRSVMNDKQAAEFESTKECNFAIAPPGVGRFRVNAFVQQGRDRHGAAHDHDRHPEVRGTRTAAGAEGRHHVEARHHDVRRRDRLRQVDVDGGAARLSQREQLRPHHHDRGSDRIRPRAQELHRHAARGRRGHRGLGHRAAEFAAPGARRHPDRRSARARDDGLRDLLRRDRPPVPRDAAREQHEPGARPDHQLLPRGAPRRSC